MVRSVGRGRLVCAGVGLLSMLAAGAAPAEDAAALANQAKQIFGPLPQEAVNPANPITQAKVDLGQKLYFDPRFSKNQDISCNSCHPLDRFGADGEPTSPGHKGQRGDRNSPTSLNAALHVAQFWDGREPDVEHQALGPPLNPVEMSMPGGEAVVAVLKSIPGYGPLFEAAFPGEKDPITYQNFGRAIGAFERRLLTPGRFDAFMNGDYAALTEPERAGLQAFISTGCITCHNGPAVGGLMFQKLGLVKPYPTNDPGRYKVTQNEADRGVFKVPGLRNVGQTAPYFHDGSIQNLDEVIRVMARHQLGKELDEKTIASIAVFLGSLTAAPDPVLSARPRLPESGPKTPAPDPS
jgi:cytochrome c peroxidase